jgi:hypothetical protein
MRLIAGQKGVLETVSGLKPAQRSLLISNLIEVAPNFETGVAENAFSKLASEMAESFTSVHVKAIWKLAPKNEEMMYGVLAEVATFKPSIFDVNFYHVIYNAIRDGNKVCRTGPCISAFTGRHGHVSADIFTDRRDLIQ